MHYGKHRLTALVAYTWLRLRT